MLRKRVQDHHGHYRNRAFLFAAMMFVVSRVIKAIGYGVLEVFGEFAPDWVLIQPSEGSMVHRTLTPLGRMGLVAPDGSSAGG